MYTNSNDFFKGLPGYTRGSDELRPEDVETGIYYRWWRLMRLSPLFWYAAKTKLPIEDVDAYRAYGLAGDLSQRKFELWWSATGRKVFAEPQRPRKVRVIDLEQPPETDLYERSVVVEIPLTVTKQKIFRELRKIINERHIDSESLSKRFNVTQYSKADLKLHTKKFLHTTIDDEYYALVYRILFPDTQLWLLADRLRLTRSSEVRDVDNTLSREKIAERKLTLQAKIGRCIYKAQFSRHHLERGTFPKYEKVDWENALPFGSERNANFKKLTKEGKPKENENMSEWQVWVDKEHGPALRDYICKKNGIERKEGMSIPDFNKRLHLYMSSMIDFEPKVASIGQITQGLKRNTLD